MAYFEAKGLTHGSLTCSNVLLHPRGIIKIGRYAFSHSPVFLLNHISVAQEDCVPKPDKSNQDIKALSSLTMVLLQGYCKDDDSIGVDHPELLSLNVVDFLSQTTSAASAGELQAVRLATLFYTVQQSNEE
jgi:hypothetical protein